jgi:hypothetical protein
VIAEVIKWEKIPARKLGGIKHLPLESVKKKEEEEEGREERKKLLEWILGTFLPESVHLKVRTINVIKVILL